MHDVLVVVELLLALLGVVTLIAVSFVVSNESTITTGDTCPCFLCRGNNIGPIVNFSCSLKSRGRLTIIFDGAGL